MIAGRLVGGIAKAALVLLGLVLADGMPVSPHALAQEPRGDAETPVAGSRFASLRADDVNVRTGPGVRYPVIWKFVTKNMPVEVVAEYDTWRKIRDFEGAEGWVHRAMLSSRRSVMLVGGEQTMRRRASDASPAVARLAPGVVGLLQSCEDGWCLVQVERYEGWIRQNSLWGLYPDEEP